MNIANFYLYHSQLAAGGQPGLEDLQKLKEQGYEAVVNLSPASTKNYLTQEAAEVEKLSMDYIHFPVDCSHLRDLHYEMFRGILNALKEKKIFVHCGGNIKTSCLLHLYLTREMKWNEEESLAILKSIHTPEEKWNSYFKNQGLRGL